MAVLINTKLGQNRGKSRIWLEGAKLAREGYEPGDRYDLSVSERKVVLEPSSDGQYIISKRTRNGRTNPIIDISRHELADKFENVELLRVAITQGKIVVTAHHQVELVETRVQRLLDKVANGEPLRTGSLFHAAGGLDIALHEGFRSVGINAKVGVAVELEAKYLDASLVNNPDIWDESSIPMNTPIQALDLRGFRGDQQLDIVCGGIPCEASSQAGMSKNRLQRAEDHPTAGALFFNFLSFIQAANPALVIAENVPNYQDTASMAVIRSVLGSLDYEVHERVMDGTEFGALEKRQRLCVVAVSKGLEDKFDLNAVMPHLSKPDTIQSVIEPFDDIPDTAWRSYDYLAKKEVRDKEAGKGFARQLLTPDAPHVGTIGKGYNKARSTEPFLKHPNDPALSRLFTPREHARLKGLPEKMVANLSATVAHEVLGQSIIFPVFRDVSYALGQFLRQELGLEERPDKQAMLEDMPLAITSTSDVSGVEGGEAEHVPMNGDLFP